MSDGKGGEMSWAANEPGFMGTVRQITCCAKCGDRLHGGPNKPRKTFDLFKPTLHFLCDACFECLRTPPSPSTNSDEDGR